MRLDDYGRLMQSSNNRDSKLKRACKEQELNAQRKAGTDKAARLRRAGVNINKRGPVR